MTRTRSTALAVAAMAALILLTMLSGRAGARIIFPTLDSVEWLVNQSPAIARCRVLSGPTTRPGAYPRCEVEVVEVLKGKLSPKVRLAIPAPSAFEDSRRAGCEILVFFQPSFPVPPSQQEDGSLGYMGVFPLWTDGRKLAMSMDMTWINTPARLLEVTRAAVVYDAREGAATKCIALSQSFGSDWWNEPVVNVPADQRLHALARQWFASSDPEVRLHSIQAMNPFREPEDVARLRELLGDVALSPQPNGVHRGASRTYIVRQWAVNCLQAWNVPFDMPPVRTPAFNYVDRSARAAGFFLLPPVLGLMIVLALWPTRLRMRAAMALAMVCAIGACQILALRHRSWRTADDLFVTPKLVLTSSAGLLTLQTGEVVPAGAEFPPEVTFLALASDGEFLPRAAAWDVNQTNVRIKTPVLVYATGRPGARVGLVISVPHLGLAGLFAMGPAVALGRLAYRRLRTRRRRRAGLCGGCGYDLRGAASERCPECGGAVDARARVGASDARG